MNETTEQQEVKVVRCMHCDNPATAGSGSCVHCGKPLTGKEPEYIAFTPMTADWRNNIKPLLISYLVIFVFSGFSIGKWATLAIILVTVVALLKSLREM